MPAGAGRQARGGVEFGRLGWLGKLFGGRRRDPALIPLYAACVERGREPHWYLEGGVPDTIDGRFDAIAAVLSAVLLRLEADPAGAEPAARLAEHFIDDMDSQLRQLGVGDLVVGKQVGRMVGMLGGRLGAYRDGLAAHAPAGALDAALARNLYRGGPPAPAALAHARDALLRLRDRLAAAPVGRLVAGDLP